jgi:hypothetical protein
MGDEEKRAQYAAYKRRLIRPQVELRERIARECAAQTQFKIPQNKGFLALPPGTFPEVAEIVADARERIERIKPEEQKAGRKTQLRTGNLDNSTLDLDSPYLRFATREDVLCTVADYLGVAPLLTQVDVWFSLHSEKEFSNSQLYHCDWADARQIKLFIFATDVDETSGPLTMLPADKSKELRDKIGYKWSTGDNKLQDEQVYGAVGRDDETPILGPAGTSAFLDTSRCFHFGSRVEASSKPRIMVLVQYMTPTAFALPRNFTGASPFLHLAQTPTLSPLQRLVLGAKQ